MVSVTFRAVCLETVCAAGGGTGPEWVEDIDELQEDLGENPGHYTEEYRNLADMYALDGDDVM